VITVRMRRPIALPSLVAALALLAAACSSQPSTTGASSGGSPSYGETLKLVGIPRRGGLDDHILRLRTLQALQISLTGWCAIEVGACLPGAFVW
jgi:hypothetical protein